MTINKVTNVSVFDVETDAGLFRVSYEKGNPVIVKWAPEADMWYTAEYLKSVPAELLSELRAVAWKNAPGANGMREPSPVSRQF